MYSSLNSLCYDEKYAIDISIDCEITDRIIDYFDRVFDYEQEALDHVYAYPNQVDIRMFHIIKVYRRR